MNQVTDPLKVISSIRPAMLDSMAEDGYRRKRQADLAAIAADGRSRGTRIAGQRRAVRRPLTLAVSGLAVAAAAAVAVATALPAGHPSPVSRGTTAAGGNTAGPVSAREFLLTSAVVAARSAEATGTYWYVKQRYYGPAEARVGKPTKLSKPQKPAEADFGAMYASTEESWTGQARARTIVNEDLVITFASAAGKARWEAAGRPPLMTAAGWGVTTPVTSDYTMTLHWGVGSGQLSLADVEKLPTTAAGLGKVLRFMWNREADKAGAVGIANPTYTDYLVAWAGSLLDGPASVGTKAALYQLLAEQPGIGMVKGVTDLMGRTGVAVGDGAGDFLVIDPDSAQLIDYVAAGHVKDNSVLPKIGTTVYISAGWTGQLGVTP